MNNRQRGITTEQIASDVIKGGAEKLMRRDLRSLETQGGMALTKTTTDANASAADGYILRILAHHHILGAKLSRWRDILRCFLSNRKITSHYFVAIVCLLRLKIGKT